MCRYCEKYFRPPWLSGKLESPQLLNICLYKIKGISKVKIVDSGFIWTEPHSKRIHVRLRVQQEVEGVLMEQECIVKFIVQDTQCDDCKKSFTPHSWVAKVQVRQKTDHMRTLLHFEQLILKNNVNKDFLAVKQKINGFDVHFSSKSLAKKFIDFIHAQTPCQVKESKQLISSDFKSNTYNYKYTYIADINPICKDDLLILPPSWKVAGLGKILLCTKVTTQIHVVDVFSFQKAEIKNPVYWKNSFDPYGTKSRLTEFIVLDIEELGNELYDVEVTRNSDARFGEITYRVRTHLGKNLICGDTVLGYDLVTIVPNQWEDTVIRELPDVILVKKPNQKIVKAQRLPGLEEKEISDSEEEKENAEVAENPQNVELAEHTQNTEVVENSLKIEEHKDSNISEDISSITQ